ncbi:zinc metalloprotease [Sphingomonas ginkgonis]|uniref:Zinc metalloprotease n=1 Tax=Sphingomonas ginkgonis TaxID=2315330 RepID=A0A3R9YNB0_9SPHN|nr:neutral zinc metallopeptidase [Sphingomonas ginkgonis]RST31403.1 zinc metalloprotease [Sphingomonas ginkgonis]
MRLDDQRESSNFQDDTGRGGVGFGGGGIGGGGLGMILSLVASRFGIVGVVVLLLGYCALQSIGGLGGGGGIGTGGPGASAPAGQSTLDPQTKQFVTRVLGSTEDTWSKIFAARGQQYQPTRLVAYSQTDRSGCGVAQSAMGPFYCPTDKEVYLDTTFFNELSQRFQAPGDFAMAYVIAHEVGHHVQHLEGTLDQAHNAQASASEAEGNAVQVKVELQADCYAGVWAANARDSKGQAIMEPGDFEEGMRAAQAIGDDTLQKQSQGRVVPESFTHGTSAQRMAALRTGFQSGNPDSCRSL